jgi:beta-glucosidase
MSDNRFIANIPTGIFDTIKWATRTYPNLPIIITENGVEDSDDHIRPRYLAQHIHQVWRAVNFNWPVKGYFHWTLVDNFEWDLGWDLRFGLYELDVPTGERRARPSAALFGRIARENAVAAEVLARYG